MYASKTRDRLVEFFRRYIEDGSEALRQNPVVKQCLSVDEIIESPVLFFVTTGRTGTKSVIDYLQRHSMTYAVHAPTPPISSIGYRHFRDKISAESGFWSYYATRERYLQSAAERELLFCDGDCKVLPLVGALAKMLPNSRFIHIYREPGGFIRSGLARGYYASHSPELWGHLYEGELPSELSLEDQARYIARFWELANCIAAELQADVGDSRFVSISSESMFKDPVVLTSALLSLGVNVVGSKNSAPQLARLNENRFAPVDGLSDDTLRRLVAEECSSLERLPTLVRA